jgi:4-hydroxy-2-oxoheptanedioate aldolase
MSNRLNGFIRAWEQGKAAFSCFAKADKLTAIDLSESPYDGVVYEMEHNPWDMTALQDALQYMLSRKQIANATSLAPIVTPISRVPANGVEMNQSQAKQALDRGIYGVLWPHIGSVEQAYNAVASCRYARPKSVPLYEPKGVRGDGPMTAARYWGLSQAEYYAKADVWPLAPHGEIVVGLMCESVAGVENLNDILVNVPGVAFVLIGDGDLSQELGVPRQYNHPLMLDAAAKVVEICNKHKVVVGNAHVSAADLERTLKRGYRLLLSNPTRSYGVAGKGKEMAGY